jgi:hypothetical protein
MASDRFDLPHPFGPTMAATPLPVNRISERSQKDLKPCSSTRLRISNGRLPFDDGQGVSILLDSEQDRSGG